MCRDFAAKFSNEVLPRLETAELGAGKSVACLAIGYGERGAAEFLDGGYWSGPRETTGPFVDPEPEVAAFKLFGTKTLGASGLLSWSVMRSVMRSKAPSNVGTSGGFQWNLAGTFVLDLEKDQIVFEHRQKEFNDHPDIDAMLAACSKAVAQSTKVPESAHGA
mmetsp:Transcript_63870/g.101231  ORF Transcript_63870/g.101231 Transcript_63870/m.101231 type:complete len:163 (-) Transcript_63870:103-591(-)